MEAVFFVLVLLGSSGLAGIAWVMQLVHYPGFADVRPERWPAYHRRHSFLISLVVGPFLAAQTLGTFGLLLAGAPWAWAHAVAWALSAGWTAAVTGPRHGPVSRANEAGPVGALVRANTLRTWAWTGQALLAAAQAAGLLAGT